MPVSANLLVVSDGSAANVIECLADEGFAIATSNFETFKSDIEANPNFDLAIIVAPESGRDDHSEDISFLTEKKIPILVVGNNPEPSKIQAVPANFCDLEIKRRIQSLIRLEIMKKEYRRRSETTILYGYTKSDISDLLENDNKRNILLVGTQSTVLGEILLQLERRCKVHVCRMAENALEELRDGSFDAVIMIGSGQGDVHLRLCTDLRTDSRLFNMPVLFVLENESNREAAYIHGASDIILNPLEMANLYVRTNLHIQQSEFRFSLQKLFKESKPLPVTDALTSLYSFGFVQAHMDKLISDHQEQGKYLCVASITVTNLKEINKEYGYPAGDQILRQIGTIISFLIRGEDFCGRYSGNQFIIALPSTSKTDAHFALKRVYGVTRNTEFSIAAIAEPVAAVIDMGLEELGADDTFSDVVKRGAKLGFTT
ncbi:MAG: diguanylate cyclase [Sneathiella sp.]|nr:diguanylate cyclase [Sneathiella sp.]